MVNLYITLPSDFDELVEEYKQQVLGQDHKTTKSNGLEVYYDFEGARLCRGNDCVSIPLASNQKVLCDALFKIPIAKWIKDIDIRDNYHKAGERSLYEAVRALNKKTRSAFGVELFEYKELHARIKPESANHKEPQ